MYKLFAYLFFTSITVAILYAFSGKDLPIGPFVVLNALLYLFFILYVFIKSFFKAKYSFQNISLVKKISAKIHDKEPLTSFLSSTVTLIYITLVCISVFFIFFLFVFPTFRDILKEKLTPKDNSSDLYSMRNDISSIKYHIKDLKLRLYYDENPQNYTDEDSKYTYTLSLDENKFYDWERNDYYNYNLSVLSKDDNLVTAGWQKGGIELHQSSGHSLKSTVKNIEGDYRNFPLFLGKPVFVVTVTDNDDKFFYIVYPNEAEYENDYVSLVNLDYVDGYTVSYKDYEFLEDEGKIRLILAKPVSRATSVLVSFAKDTNGRIIATPQLEKD